MRTETTQVYPEHVLWPMREIDGLIEARLSYARKALAGYNEFPDSPHAEPWRDQVGLLARAREAWLRHLMVEGLLPGSPAAR
jgi:hypothetical protein